LKVAQIFGQGSSYIFNLRYFFLYDLRYWGAQIVGSLEDVDWNKKANPDNVIREIKPKVDLVKFLMAKYGKEIKR